MYYEKYAVNHYTEFLSAYNESWTISVSKRGKMRPGHKGRRGQKTVQFIERASKIIIKTKNVKESLYPGLRDHIEKLLRAYRTQEENSDKERPSKMPYPAGYKHTRGRKGKIKRKEKGIKRRSKKVLLKLLRREQRKGEM